MEMNIFAVEDDAHIFDALKERLGQWSFRVAGPERFDDVLTATSIKTGVNF